MNVIGKASVFSSRRNFFRKYIDTLVDRDTQMCAGGMYRGIHEVRGAGVVIGHQDVQFLGLSCRDF